MRLIILRGLPGAGKTTFVKMLKRIEPNLVHCSADFIHEDKDGNYHFNPSRLGEGHGLCLRSTIEAMQSKAKLVIVDNTNISNVEMAPYAAAGQAFGYKVDFVRLNIDQSGSYHRNIHNVPLKSIEGMCRRFETPFARWGNEEHFQDPTFKQVQDWFLTRG